MSKIKFSNTEIDTVVSGNELVTAFIKDSANVNISFDAAKSFVDKSKIDLNNVDNTADINKPVSGPQLSALNEKANIIHSHDFVSIDGVRLMAVNETYDFIITDYDVSKVYTVTAITGSVIVNGSVISYTAPNGKVPSGFTVNGYSFNVDIVDPYIAKPSVSLLSGDKIENVNGCLKVLCSDFYIHGIDLTAEQIKLEHLSTQWLIAKDSKFTNIIHDITTATGELNFLQVPLTEVNCNYFIKARQVSQNNGTSEWSDILLVRVHSGYDAFNDTYFITLTGQQYFVGYSEINSSGDLLATVVTGSSTNIKLFNVNSSGTSFLASNRDTEFNNVADISLSKLGDVLAVASGSQYFSVYFIDQNGFIAVGETDRIIFDLSVIGSTYISNQVALSGDGNRLAVVSGLNTETTDKPKLLIFNVDKVNKTVTLDSTISIFEKTGPLAISLLDRLEGKSVYMNYDGSKILTGMNAGTDSSIKMFSKLGSSWVNILSIPNPTALSNGFGTNFSADITFNFLAVACRGTENHLFIYEFDGNKFILLDKTTDLVDYSVNGELKVTLSKDGEYLAAACRCIGSNLNDGTDTVLSIWKNNSGAWNQLKKTIKKTGAINTYDASLTISDGCPVVALTASLQSSSNNNNGHILIIEPNNFGSDINVA